MEIKAQMVAIPKETDHLEQGKYGPVFPRIPACYGFSIIAPIKRGRADAMREYGHALAKALEEDPYPDGEFSLFDWEDWGNAPQGLDSASPWGVRSPCQEPGTSRGSRERTRE